MTATVPGPDHDVTSHERLRELYRAPSSRVLAKKVARIDPAAAEIIAGSPFFLVATSDADGGCDVSPRGGPPGQLLVLDDRHLAFPDLSGNNLIDSLGNLIDNPHAGLLVLTPGRDETVRVDGRARITTDPELLDRWSSLVRMPTCAVVIEVDNVFLHCAKSFRRGGVWDPERWTELRAAPDTVTVFAEATGFEGELDDLKAALEASYAADLADEAPD